MEISSKQQLIEKTQHAFEELMACIERVPARKRRLSVETNERDRNFRDVLMHVYEWHAMLERWYREGMNGDSPSMPAAGYKWRDLAALNQQIWMNYQEISLSQALKKVTLSHQRIMQLINHHSNEEIFTKKYYKWTKTSNLYSYFAANTLNHYVWALKKCEKIAALLMEVEETVK